MSISNTFVPWNIAAFGLLFASIGTAQEVTLQQAQAECQSIAQQQAGTAPTPQPQAGGRMRGAAAGAMAGAVKGRSKANQYGNVSDEVAEEYTRNQMQDAAKAGAAVGAARQRQQRRAGQKQQTTSGDAYSQAFASCMAAKGYPGQ
ncbi:hypothetical protein [Methyloterricola oryzae]|uniref:hypothetical protein n=1 Tax=Methyloterricola oryzae TaxID=1495050 RepID=UPI00069A3189|nr:hypothetical protein [Methyloterricola oryzae]